jgi:hypothetical protein
MFEYEFETDREHECEYANEYESEDFFPFLAPLLAKAAPMAIKAVGGLLANRRRRRPQREFELEYEGEYEGDPFIGKLLSGLGGALLGEGEYEDEYEFEAAPMTEYEVMMEHLAYQAANSESEAEAEAFLGALVPMAARLIPSAAKAVSSVMPSLIQGVSKMGRTLYNSPTTRKLLQTVPTVLKGTVGTLARQVEEGKPISSQTAIRALAGNVANVLDNPKKVKRVMTTSHRAQHQAKAKMNGRKRRPAYA